jgi:outer membrane murein-binding lipoprotein Lpp
MFEEESGMKRLTFLLLIGVIVLSLSMAGCSGGGAKVEATSTNVTLGQELTDLDKAYKQGVITEKEYNEAKKKILKKYK